jgi:hypothetical protein
MRKDSPLAAASQRPRATTSTTTSSSTNSSTVHCAGNLLRADRPVGQASLGDPGETNAQGSRGLFVRCGAVRSCVLCQAVRSAGHRCGMGYALIIMSVFDHSSSSNSPRISRRVSGK